MSTQYSYGDTRPVLAPVETAQAVAVGDLVGLSSGNVVRAEDESWDTSLLVTQRNFVRKFLGVSAQKKVSGTAKPYGNSLDNRMRVDSDGVFEFDCASASFAVGDLVGPAKQSGNALESQKVVAVTYEDASIGRVVEATSSQTRVKVKLHSVMCPAARASGLGPIAATIAALTDSSGGSADNTIAAITNTANAGSADVTPVANAIADLAAKVNAILTALKDAGIVARS